MGSLHGPQAHAPVAAVPGDATSSKLVVASFYKFADLADYEELRQPIRELCEANRVSGGIILAPEGVNGSICGTRTAVDAVLRFLHAHPRLGPFRVTEAPAGPEEELLHGADGAGGELLTGYSAQSPLGAGPGAPFRWDHVRVKLKKEEKGDEEEESEEGGNVGAGQRDGGGRGGSLGADVAGRLAGEGAPSPPRTSQVAARRVAMYCTGGIRCEKASSYMLGLGYDEVYHLEGGILKYLEEVAPQESLWEGECFVFDKRVSVGPDLQPGSYGLCYSCKQPVSAADVQSPFWEEGVSCPHCHAWKSEREKERARARQLQVQRWGTVGGPDGGRRERAIARRMHGKKKALSPRQLRRAKSA
eukprot:jgi/Mesen1/7640/ME000004S07915